MNILHVMNDSVPLISGYATRSNSIVTKQRRIGIEPTVVTSLRQGPSEKDQEKIDGINYYRTNWPKRSISRKIPGIRLIGEITLFYRAIRKVALKVSPEIIHSHSPILCAIPALLAARMLRIPMVYEIRAFWEDAAVASKKMEEGSTKYKTIGRLETFVCKYAQSIVAISEAIKQDLLARGIDERKIFVVPNGVDDLTFSKTLNHEKLKSKYCLKGRTVVGYLGTFYEFEGIEDLISIFAQLASLRKKAVLLVVGGGEREPFIRRQVAQIKSGNVILVGKVPHERVGEYYKLMDLVVYPRRSSRITEMTTPLKPLEAMALGKPVICSDVGGLKELVGLGNGLFFGSGNEQAMMDCLTRLIDNPDLALRLAENGRRRALIERNWCELINRYLPIYDAAQTMKKLKGKRNEATS